MRFFWLLVLLFCFGQSSASELDPELIPAAKSFFPTANRFDPLQGSPPTAAIAQGNQLLGYVFLSKQIKPIPAYSGKPVNMLIALDTQGVIRGVKIIEHEEPILVIGVTQNDMATYTDQYIDKDAKQKIKIGGRNSKDAVAIDGISGATITTMVLNASITQSARAVIKAHSLPITHPVSLPSQVLSNEELAKTFSSGFSDAKDASIEEDIPIWQLVWEQRVSRIVILCLGLVVLTGILFFQDWITRYPRLIRWVRYSFLTYTVVFVGWFCLGQLSVINVLTFVSAMVHDFHWENFLIDPIIFILWCFVAITLLLWGRGVYCGWLCPFGAMQELINKLAQRLNIIQLPIPALIHERLLAIKYVILLALFGLSLQDMSEAARIAEIEPFKTAVILYFQRAWPFVSYAVFLLVLSIFNGKFFCKYLCPLGAALTISSHFRIFDWLRRRKECGRPCQTCSTECPSQAIRPTGEINVNECHYCLDCQITYWDAHKCPPLVEKRKRREKAGHSFKVRI